MAKPSTASGQLHTIVIVIVIDVVRRS